MSSMLLLRSRSLLVAFAVVSSACAADTDLYDEEDPASVLDHEWWDEGPPPGEEAESPEEWYESEELALDKEEADASDEEELDDAGEPKAGPILQLPFHCGQVWAGQTRTNHSPVNSVDFNRSDDFGDAVLASAPGTVTVVGNTGSTSYGRWIEIAHANGYRTRYAHLKSQGVRVGQSVRRGQRIGAVGNSGGSTGPHLHYELRHNGVAIRPSFNGSPAFFFGTRNYKSRNGCSSSPSGTNGRVRTSGAPLTIRSGPGTGHRAVGTIANGTRIRVRCHKRGTRVTGTYGTTRLWDRIGRGYISDAYVYTGTDGRVAPWCD
jgi:hypothetical protein